MTSSWKWCENFIKVYEIDYGLSLHKLVPCVMLYSQIDEVQYMGTGKRPSVYEWPLIQAKVTLLNWLPMSIKLTLVILLMHSKHFCDYTRTDCNCLHSHKVKFSNLYSNSSYIAYGGGSSGFNSVVILYLSINDWGMLQLHLLKSTNFSAMISLVVNHRVKSFIVLVALMLKF